MNEMYGCFRSWERAKFVDNPHAVLFSTPIPIGWFNDVIALSAPNQDATQEIQDAHDFFRAREIYKLRAARFWVSRLARQGSPYC